jgi:hypothetical protein
LALQYKTVFIRMFHSTLSSLLGVAATSTTVT